MASPSYTYTLTNGTTADASQVMQDFNDILNGVIDGTKDLNINALTCAGAVTLNGNVTVGNASSDDLTVTASLASTIPIKTTASYDIGSTSLLLRRLYTSAIKGTTDGTSASAGDISEVKFETRLRASGASMTTNTTLNVTSSNITLTAGRWLISAMANFNGDTSATVYNLAVSKTSATLPSNATQSVPTSGEVIFQNGGSTSYSAADYCVVIPSYVYSVSSDTPIYLVARSTFSGTQTVYGSITAVRLL
jgi:hypothetical protein